MTLVLYEPLRSQNAGVYDLPLCSNLHTPEAPPSLSLTIDSRGGDAQS
jgi:hypothetical protein